MSESETRFGRAAQIESSDVNLTGQMTAVVQSQSDEDTTYTVDLENQSCTCPDHVYRGTTCKHLAAVAESVGMFELPEDA